MMGGPGFAGGLAQGLQAGQERMMEMQRLKLMQDFNKSRMKQMEVEDQLKQMQVESLFKRMAAEERLPSLQENLLGPQAAPLDLGAQGPMPEPSPEIDRRKLVSFLQVAQDAGQDPMQLLQLMGMADPRIHAISESLKPATVHKLAPGETLVEVGGATQAQTSAAQPTDRNMLPEEAAAQAAERARPLSQEERMAQTAQQAPTGGMPDIVPGLKPPTQPTVMPGEEALSPDAAPSKPQAASAAPAAGRTVKQLFAAPAKPEKPPDMGDRLESAAAQYAVTTYGRPMQYWQLVQIDPIAAQKLRQQTLVDEPTQIASARVQATIEQQKNQLLSPEEANKLGIPFGATKQDAMGIMPITAHQRETLASYDTARVIIEDIGQYSDKVNRAAGGLMGRAQQSMKLWGAWTQSDPDAALLMSKAGELASIARSLGEKGALANQDVARAAGLVPSVTDTRDVAIRKLKDMAKIIDEGEANYRKSLGMDARKAPSSRREDAPSDTSSTIQVPPGLTPQQAEVYKKAYAEERQRKQQQMRTPNASPQR